MLSESANVKNIRRSIEVSPSNANFLRLDFSDMYTAFNLNARFLDPESSNRATVFRKREIKNYTTPELRPATLVMSLSDDEKENSMIPNNPAKRIRTHGRFISNQ
jgi:hypothetical protein